MSAPTPIFFNVAFSEFNNRATIRFFERLGVKLDIERGERVFPHSGKAWDIANALTEYCEEHGVEIMYHTRVTEILTLGGRVYGVKYINRRGFERKEECENVIVATGGVSYPRPVRRATATPSPMLWGIRSSRCVRHSRRFARRTLRESISTDCCSKRRCQTICRQRAPTGGVRRVRFSERGIEGAVALRVSRAAVDALIDQKRVKLVLDLKPALDADTLRERIRREMARHAARRVLRRAAPQARAEKISSCRWPRRSISTRRAT